MSRPVSKSRSRSSLAAHLPLLGLFLVFSPAADAENHEVDSLAALKSAAGKAAPGDIITVKNGSYTTTGPLIVRAAGTAESPITIQAESIAGVEIAGTHGFQIMEPAAHVVIAGFKFTHASGRSSIGPGTSHVRFTRNTFACVGDGPYLSVIGDDAQIDHNEFGEKNTTGSMVAIGGTGSQVARRAWIHHNHFHDLLTAGSTSSEMLRLGLFALSQSTGAAIVEYNLFARCRGENELVSNRSSGNTYRHNTFIDSPTSQLTLRHGNECIVYGNYLRNTEGVRFFGDRHLVHSNHIERSYIGINLGNGSTDGAEDTSGSGHDRPDNCVVVFNTLIDNRTHFQMSRRSTQALGAMGTVFANNVIMGGSTAAKIEGPHPDATWSGNVLWTVIANGDFPDSGAQRMDPELEVIPDGVARPREESPLIAAATGEFPAVQVDIDGQTRPPMKTIGADDVSTNPGTVRALTPEDVGPHRP